MPSQQSLAHPLTPQAFYGVFWATFYRPRIVVVLAIIQSIAFMALFALFYRWPRAWKL